MAYVATNVVILAADLARVHASSYVWTQYAFFALYLLLPRTPLGATAPSGAGAVESGRAAR